MPPFDRSSAVGFCLNPLNRLSEKRDDEAFLDAMRHAPSTRYMVLVGDVPLLRQRGGSDHGHGDARSGGSGTGDSSTTDSGATDATKSGSDDSDAYNVLFSHDEAAALGEPVRDIFLGQAPDGAAMFAVGLDKARAETLSARAGLVLVELRSIAMRGLVTPELLGELGGAKAMLDWHQRHRFCANCGAPSRASAAGWRRECDVCATQHFPRVDPVVIMMAVDGDRCLLGRQPRFPPGMYSALAGFLEPGETIEDAVRREIKEESGIACSHVSYFASQPWPFPSSLMIGCFARAQGTEVIVDRTELEDARWFVRAEVRQMLAGTHPDGLSAPKPFAIAYHLLKAFADDEPHLLPEGAGRG